MEVVGCVVSPASLLNLTARDGVVDFAELFDAVEEHRKKQVPVNGLGYRGRGWDKEAWDEAIYGIQGNWRCIPLAPLKHPGPMPIQPLSPVT